MRPMNMKNASTKETTARCASGGRNAIAYAGRFRCGSRIQRGQPLT